ncbi:MAG: hypothetical protein WA152_02820 [Microgenomates group bacterium]
MSEQVFADEVAATNIPLTENVDVSPFRKKPNNKVTVRVQNGQTSSLRVESPTHGRDSTIVPDPKNTDVKILFGGKYPTDVFGDTTIKGVNMKSTPTTERYSYNDYKTHTIGLMDKDVLKRMERASDVMRKLGLPTEFPRKAWEINEIWVTNTEGVRKKITIEEWKELEINRIKSTLKEMYNANDSIKYIKQVKFIAVERDVQINIRLEDIERFANEHTLEQKMKPVFNWLNQVIIYKKPNILTGDPPQQPFTTSPEDLARYFTEYYPAQAGAYIGTMRKNKLFHGFLHSGNFQGVPTVLDLDSVTGKLIFEDDPEPSNKDFAQDLCDAVNSISGLISNTFKTQNSLGWVDYHSKTKESIKIFFKNYINNAYGPNPTQEDIHNLEEGLAEIDMLGAYKEMINDLKTSSSNKTNLDQKGKVLGWFRSLFRFSD